MTTLVKIDKISKQKEIVLIATDPNAILPVIEEAGFDNYKWYIRHWKIEDYIG